VLNELHHIHLQTMEHMLAVGGP